LRTLLKGGMIYMPDGFRRMDISIAEGKVFEVAGNINENNNYEKVIRCDNFFIMPGLIDVHVHFREPGFEYKETIATGSRAAARGGYTTVCTMPNLKPAPVDEETLKVQTDIIRKDAIVNIVPYGAITSNQSGRGRLSDMQAMADDVVAFTDDGKGVQKDTLMSQAMLTAKSLGKMIVAHCEDEHYPTEDPRSEWNQVARDISLAMMNDCAYHVCHVSTGESVDLVRAGKGAGVDVSCETAPHYLVFSSEEVPDEGRFKMNPPLRTAKDKAALLAGIKDGTIEIIATDHAPHSAEEKKGGFADSLFGVIGLETAFPVLYTQLVKKGEISLEHLVQLMSVNPARRFSLPGGSLQVGAPADIAVIDLEAQYRIDPQTFSSKGRSTPFSGMEVFGETVLTMVAGRIVYER
jgi:dihydroorotase